MKRFRLNDLVVVEEDELGARVIIECDDRTGTGLVLEKISQVLPQAVPPNWLQILWVEERKIDGE